VETEDERILRQRALATRLANTGQRAGYLLLLVAMVLFFVGLVVGYTDTIVRLVIGAFVAGAVVLGPSIILGYAAKAADRFEKTGKTGH
jgi:sugar phosphate permease